MITALNLGRRYIDIKEEYVSYLDDIMHREIPCNGYYASKVERYLEKTSGRKHALLTNTGSIALLLSLFAHRVGHGDEVIVTNYSSAASLGYVLVAGATPIFCDVDDTGNMIVDNLEYLLTDNTAAIVGTGLYGDMHNHTVIQEFATKYKLLYINDAAQSMFSKWNGIDSLACGDIVAMSHAENKPLPALGQGGAILTDDTDIYNKLIHLRKNGKPYRKAPYTRFGVNGIIDDDKAASILCSIHKFSEWQKRRIDICNYYKSEFNRMGVESRRNHPEWNTHKYAILFPNKWEAQQEIKLLGVETEAQYANCLGPDMPGSIDMVNRSLTLPSNPYMTDAEVEIVVKVVDKVWKKLNTYI
tara:strand:- start:90 stop:1163 length:1074 start_codon:yes stop_codon:yes gene_type:complete